RRVLDPSGRSRQRPHHTATRVPVPRASPRRQMVRRRIALATGVSGRCGRPGRPRVDARAGARSGAARCLARACRRRAGLTRRADVIHLVFVEPRIPPNTGNAIRLVAATGAHLHLVEPLGFTMTDAQLRRAGLDYHDLAQVTVHESLDALWAAVLPARVYAFT